MNEKKHFLKSLDEVSSRYIREKKDEEKGEEVAILAVKVADMVAD
jgi:hypothetical protein